MDVLLSWLGVRHIASLKSQKSFFQSFFEIHTSWVSLIHLYLYSPKFRVWVFVWYKCVCMCVYARMWPDTCVCVHVWLTGLATQVNLVPNLSVWECSASHHVSFSPPLLLPWLPPSIHCLRNHQIGRGNHCCHTLIIISKPQWTKYFNVIIRTLY